MAANDYIDADDLSAVLTDPDAGLLAGCITAASRVVDAFCGRVFYASADEARVWEYPAESSRSRGRYVVLIDDLTPDDDLTVVALTDDGEGGWTEEALEEDVDYWWFPINDESLAPAGLKTRIELTARTDRLRITGDWGFCAAADAPEAIKAACRMIARRLYERCLDDEVLREGIGNYAITYVVREGEKHLKGAEQSLLNPYRRVRV